MIQSPILEEELTYADQVAAETIERIITLLDYLPQEQLEEVLQFIEFLEHRIDLEEVESLWDAVQANERYKQAHPDEPLESYASGEAFLEAVKDL